MLILISLLLMQQPQIAPGTVLMLSDWDNRGDVAVTVRAISDGPVPWRDGAGKTHVEPTVTYDDPRDGSMTTTVSWFSKHMKVATASKPVQLRLTPVGMPVSLYDLPFVFPPPLYAPSSNQTIKDGIARPADFLYSVPRSVQDYYSTYRARTGSAR